MPIRCSVTVTNILHLTIGFVFFFPHLWSHIYWVCFFFSTSMITYLFYVWQTFFFWFMSKLLKLYLAAIFVHLSIPCSAVIFVFANAYEVFSNIHCYDTFDRHLFFHIYNNLHIPCLAHIFVFFFHYGSNFWNCTYICIYTQCFPCMWLPYA